MAAGRRWVLGTWAGAVTLGAIVDGLVDGGAVGAAVAGVLGDCGAGVVVGSLVEGDAVVVGGAVAAGSSVAVGVVGGMVAVARVESAARPANTPTPAIPPAAIQRVAIVVRARPRSRSSSGCGRRGGWARLGGSTGWDGIGILSISVVPGSPDQVREPALLGKRVLRVCWDFDGGKGNGEDGAPIRVVGDRHVAVVGGNGVAHDGQPQAGAGLGP